jgi:hypothetical protein
MNNAWKYLLVGLLIFVLVFAMALPFFGGGWGPYQMGPWMMGPRMMHGYNGFGGFSMFGGLMMFGMILVPLILIGAVIAGVVALVRGIAGSSTPPAARPCPHCSRYIQAEWVVCPYCGQKP